MRELVRRGEDPQQQHVDQRGLNIEMHDLFPPDYGGPKAEQRRQRHEGPDEQQFNSVIVRHRDGWASVGSSGKRRRDEGPPELKRRVAG